MQWPYLVWSCSDAAVMSHGLALEPKSGIFLRSATAVCGAKGGSDTPSSSALSAAITAAPPEADITPTPGADGLPALAKNAAS
jgi:hypothetical protein